MEFSRAWEGFNPGEWNEKVNVSDFIKRNYTEYTGDSSFLSGATERTKELMEKFSKLLDKERENGGVLSVDTSMLISDRCSFKVIFIFYIQYHQFINL